MKIQIEIPDECTKCPCYTTATTKEDSQFHICKAFNQVLPFTSDMFRGIMDINRCDECVRQTVKEIQKDG